MADLAKSSVTILRSWYEGGLNGKRRICRTVEISGGAGGVTAGGTTNKIPAAVFDLRVIEECSMGILDNSTKAVFLVPAPDGLNLHTCSLVQTTDANRDNLADYTVAASRKLRFVVKGY